MRVVRLRSWRGFARAIREVRAELDGTDSQLWQNAKVLFRGQSDARWNLRTTLERRSDRPFSLLRYYATFRKYVSEIETFTKHNWNVPEFPVLLEAFSLDTLGAETPLPAYELLVYLRHHGYPSPLLDWTESPYIAAHFAFADSASKDVAIFCYIESKDGTKSASAYDPHISLKGPFIRSHVRHFSQQAWYTIATKWNEDIQGHMFCTHEDVFSKHSDSQDILTKIILPAASRRDAMRALHDFNINDFALFQNEDGLVRAIAARAFDIDEQELTRKLKAL